MKSPLDAMQNNDFEPLQPKKKISSGTILLAREALQDPNFEASIVLVCVHNNEGSYGLVLNRISHMPLSEIFDGVNKVQGSREILIGGPVQQNELQIISITATPAEGAFEIAPEIFIGGKWEDFHQMINADETTTRLFLGYSGWGPQQLESEVEIGAWDIYTIDIKQLLLNCHHLVGTDRSTIVDFFNSISL